MDRYTLSGDQASSRVLGAVGASHVDRLEGLACLRRSVLNVLFDLRYGAMYPEKGSTETANTAYDVLAEIFPRKPPGG
jgi:hypothetical protein